MRVFVRVCVCVFVSVSVRAHPSLDTPQKKKQKTHLGDSKIYQVEGMDIPKQELAKFSYGRFLIKLIQKLCSLFIATCLKIEPFNIAH